MQNHVFFFFKKTLKYTYQQRDAIDGNCQVLNMKLNIRFGIPSKYIEDICVTVSVSLLVYFQNGLTHLVRIFSFGFWHFSSYG